MSKANRHLLAFILALLVAGCMHNAQKGVSTDTPPPALPTATLTMTAAPTLASTAAPIPTPSQVVPTHTLVPQLTHTATPATRPQAPTATQQAPLPTGEPSAERVQFAPRATSATLTGRIVRKEQSGVEFGTEYLVRAFAGQTMQVAITSPNNDVLLTIVGADGSPLKRYADGAAEWRGELYATQDYTITPASVGGTTDYTLTVSISAMSLPEPIRVQLEPGTTRASVTGDLRPKTLSRYVLRALRGQKLEVHISPASSISLAVEGQDGSFWSGSPFEGALVIDKLPATQDYVITLALVPTAELAHYTLEVTATGAGSGD